VFVFVLLGVGWLSKTVLIEGFFVGSNLSEKKTNPQIKSEFVFEKSTKTKGIANAKCS
jgi:hypothetical protein